MAALVFPGFQTLDCFGPIEILGGFRDEITGTTIAKGRDPVPSRYGQKIVVDRVLSEKADFDLLFVPGGESALQAACDAKTIQWIR